MFLFVKRGDDNIKNNRITNIIGLIIIIAAFVFIIKTLISFELNWSDFLTLKYIILVLLSALTMGVTVYINTYIWYLILNFLSRTKTNFKSAFNVYSKSNLGKYLPGNVGHYAGRQFFGASLGLKQPQLALASMLEILYNTLAAFLLSFILVWGKLFYLIKEIFPNTNFSLIIIVFFIIGIALFAALYLVFRKKDFFIELLLQIKTKYFWLLFLKGVMFSVINLFAISLIFVFLIDSNSALEIGNYQIIIAAFATSWLIGFVTPGVPGGIGVREAVLTLMLAPFYPMEIVLTAGVFQRMSFIIGDVLAWLLSVLILKTNKNKGIEIT